MSYLRLTPQEFRAISLVCGPIELTEDFFPQFQRLLALSLPELAVRINGLRKGQLRLLFDRLREERGQAPGRLTAAEFEALAEVCRNLPFGGRFRRLLKDFLVLHFRKSLPGLAGKLKALSGDQFYGLWERVHGERRPNP